MINSHNIHIFFLFSLKEIGYRKPDSQRCTGFTVYKDYIEKCEVNLFLYGR